MISLDLEKRRHQVCQILDSATPLLLENYTPNPGSRFLERREKLQTQNKSSFSDIVTFYDHKVEEFLSKKIKEHFPQDFIFGEETFHHLKKDWVAATANLDSFWVIDPIDGTTNFSRSYPFFCSTMAYLQRDQKTGQLQVVCGAIWDPVKKEMYSASMGGGAWLGREKMCVSGVSDPVEALCITGFASLHRRDENKSFETFMRLTKKTMGVRRDGSAALDLAYVASGRVDAFWEEGLAPWDVAAGALLVMEAGGQVTHFGGEAWDPLSGIILSSNKRLHKWLLETL